jgi:hypothetical protein
MARVGRRAACALSWRCAQLPMSGSLRPLSLVACGAALALTIQALTKPATSDAAAHVVNSHCAEQAQRLVLLEESMRQLRARALEIKSESSAAPAAVALPQPQAEAAVAVTVTTPPPVEVVAGGGPSPLPAPKQRWSWSSLIMSALRPFDRLNGGITLRGLRLAEQKCKISTWCHRAQVIDGRLYITDLRSIFFDRHYAMARIMPLLLAMKRFPVPNVDVVFSGTDYPIIELPRDAAHMQRMYGPGQPIPPLFSPTANSVSLDLPWPDFSFVPPLSAPGMPSHPLKTPRWQKAHPSLLSLGAKTPFDDKIDRAVFELDLTRLDLTRRRPRRTHPTAIELRALTQQRCGAAEPAVVASRWPGLHGQHEDLAQPPDHLPPGAVQP